MINYLKGAVSEIQPSSISYEVNGIGYQVFVSNSYSFDKKINKIYIYQHIKEDENTLYGFKSEVEKAMFIDLILVKGIGPKTALAILTTGEIEFIKQAIVNQDSVYLQKFPKIGKKAAQQIIIDLSGKYDQSAINTINQNQFNTDNEVIEALVVLGYKQKEITKSLDQVDQSLSTEDKIRQTLKKMIK